MMASLFSEPCFSVGRGLPDLPLKGGMSAEMSSQECRSEDRGIPRSAADNSVALQKNGLSCTTSSDWPFEEGCVGPKKWKCTYGNKGHQVRPPIESSIPVFATVAAVLFLSILSALF